MTSLHARAAAILAGDLRPDVRGVIEELVALVGVHAPDPVATSMPITLCRICTEKLRRLPDGSWEHFGQDQPYVAEPASPLTDSEAGQ